MSTAAMQQKARQPKLPTYFISHGGGPWPYMKSELGHAYEALERSLIAIPEQIKCMPRAILMISAHWEEREFTVMAHPRPPMVYDYGGFPPHTYQVRYDAPGAPDLAADVRAALQAAGLPSQLDHARGFDHGAFVPMAVMYPKADVPLVQLSLKAGLDPETHLRVGRALAPFREHGVLIVGSGLSYHNLRRFGPAARTVSSEFDDWLSQVLSQSDFGARTRSLLEWESAPSARQAHPREEHLIPLMVAVGAAENDKTTLIYNEKEFFGGISVSSFAFGLEP